MPSPWLDCNSRRPKRVIIWMLYLSIVAAFLLLYKIVGINVVIFSASLAVVGIILNMLSTRRKLGFEARSNEEK